VNDYPLLCSPLEAGRLRLRNRVVMTAMTTGFGYEQGVPDEDLIAYFAERSGDIALATVGFGAVTPEGRVEDRIPWMWREDIAERLAPLADAIQARGALASLQLGHGGRQVGPSVIGGTPVAPSPLPPLVHVRTPPHELTVAEIDGIIVAFAAAAHQAAAAGFGAVEVHAGHGYLIHEFLSADANRRRDGYGGATVGERARFGVEVIAAVRAAAPELGLIVRINGTDLYPEGLGPQDAAQVGSAFAAAGADALIVSAGVYGTVPYTIPLLDDGEAPYLEAAAHVRAHVEIPVIAVGGFTRPALAEAAIARGDCDAVALGRALIADPDWLGKARAGAAARIRPCVATVDACAGMLAHGDPISCSVNPEVGRERRAPIPRASRPRRVAVVGLGPAGLEAACRAAELGHEVIAFEQDDRAGGAAALAARTPPLARYDRLIAWYERRLGEAGVQPLFGVRADGERLAGCEADLVILATGAVTDPPALDGYDELAAWPVEDLLDGGPSTLGGRSWPSRPVIVGDGRVAAATALALARHGAECTLLGRARPASDASGLARRAYASRLAHLGVRCERGFPARLTAEGVWWRAAGEAVDVLARADGVVLADRRRPERPDGLAALGCEMARIGDARVPRDLTAAIAEGREAAESFARLDLVGAGRA
jgi:2,4-dienoyl-CoA reductase-like NADH-dependent reductase (Old Yellow Enzyme family)